MADQPVEKIYAEIGFKSTLSSDLAGITESITAADEIITAFANSVLSAGPNMASSFSASCQQIIKNLEEITASIFASTQEINASLAGLGSTAGGSTTGLGATAEAASGLGSSTKSASINIDALNATLQGLTAGTGVAVTGIKAVGDAYQVTFSTMGKEIPFVFTSSNQVFNQLNTLFRQTASTAKDSSKTVVNSMEEMGKSFAKTRNVMDLFTTAIIALPAILIGKFEGLGIEMAAEFEVVSLQLERFYGDLETATDRFQRFSQIAAKTPFQFDEIMRSVLMMKDIGINADAYINTLMDTSSAMNRTLDESTRTFVAAIGGRFQMLRNYGIYAYQVTKTNMDEISKMAGREVEVGQTALLYYDMQGRQKVDTVSKYNKEMVASTLEAIWNEKFAGAMEKFSQTFTGLWSTVKDTFQYAVAEIVGYSMDDMSIRTVSLISVLKLLEKGLITTFNALSSLGGPAQTFIAVTLTSIAVLTTFVAGVSALGVLLPAVGTGLTALTAVLGGATVAAEGATVAVTGLNAALAFGEAITGVLEVVAVLAVLAATVDYLQENFGILDPFIETFNNKMTIASYGLPIFTKQLEEGISNGLKPYADGLWKVINAVDEFLKRYPSLKAAVDSITESFKLLTGIKILEWMNDTSKNVAESTRERAQEIRLTEEGLSKVEEELSNKSKNNYGSTLQGYSDMTDGIGENADALNGYYESNADTEEDAAQRQQRAFEETAKKYSEELKNMQSLQDSGFVYEDPSFDYDFKQYEKIDDNLQGVEDDIDKSTKKLDDLNKKYDKVKTENEKTLTSLQKDMDKQTEELNKLLDAGVDNNPEVLRMERDLVKEKEKLSELYSDDSIQKEKEKLAELYSDDSIEKEKRKLSDLYSDTSIQKEKEKLAELYSTEQIDDAKEKLKEIYEDDSIEEAKEKLTELYSTKDIDKEVKKLQELYADDSIQEAKEKLTELYSTEDIDKEKQRLVDLFNDDSVQEAKEKLFELQSDTGGIDSERSKLADLQNDLKNNREYALLAKESIQEELQALQSLFDKLSQSQPKTSGFDLESVTDPVLRKMIELRDSGETGNNDAKEAIKDRMTELKEELAKLSPNSQDYTNQLTSELEEAKKQAEELLKKSQSDPTSENINAYMQVQAKILDLEKAIVESKNNPNVDVVTDLENQVKEQQTKIAQMETDRAKEIQDQKERILELEKEREDNIKEQREKISQMEIDHNKAIQEQHDKIVQMEIEHQEAIKEQSEKITEMKADREKAIADQQEKITKLEEERAKDIKDQEEKIVKLTEQREKDINEQQDKIAEMEKERAEKIAEQEEKIADMKIEHDKKIKEQEEKIVKMQEQAEDDKRDQQDRINDMEASIEKKKQELNEKIEKAYEDLEKTKEKYQDTILDQSQTMTDLQGQITDQNTLIMDLQAKYDKLSSEKKIYEAKIVAEYGSDERTGNEVAGKGVELNYNEGFPKGSEYRLVQDPNTGGMALSYYDEKHIQQIRLISDLHLKDETILDGVHGKYIIIDKAVNHSAQEIQRLYDLEKAGAFTIITINDQKADSYNDIIKRQEAVAKGENIFFDLGLQNDNRTFNKLKGQYIEVENEELGVITQATTLNTLLQDADKISFVNAIAQLNYLHDIGQVNDKEWMTVYAYLCLINDKDMGKINGEQQEIGKWLTENNVHALGLNQGLDAINEKKLDKAATEVWKVDQGISTSVDDSIKANQQFDIWKDQKLDGVSGEVDKYGNKLDGVATKTGDVKTGTDSVNESKLDKIVDWAKWLWNWEAQDAEGNKLVKASILDVDKQGYPNISKETQNLTYLQSKGKKENEDWNLTITEKDGLKYTKIGLESDTLIGKQGEGKKSSGEWNDSIEYTDTLKTGNITGEVKTTGKEIDTSKGKTDLFSGALGILDGLSLSSITSEIDTISTAIDTGKKKLETFLYAVANYVPGAKSLIESYIKDLEKAWNEYVAPVYTAKAPPSSKGNNTANVVKATNNNTAPTVNNVKIGTQNNNGATLQTQKVQSQAWWLP